MTDIVSEGTRMTATEISNGTPSLRTPGDGEMTGRGMNAWLPGAKGKLVSANENCATAVTGLHGMQVTVLTDAGLLEMIGTVGERDRVARTGGLVRMVKTVMTARIASERKSLLGWILISRAVVVVELLAAIVPENWMASRRLGRRCNRKTNPTHQ
jgi:hypothetical protein